MNNDLQRFNCLVFHRRAGKSVYAVAKLVEQATQNDTPSGQYFYIGPTMAQARAIAFKYLCKFAEAMPGSKINKSMLSLELPGGASITLKGVDNVDSLRGLYAKGVVIDEAQLMPLSHWTYVIRPLLADHKGWAIIMGTPSGQQGLLGWAIKQEGFYRKILTVHDTTALDPEEVEQMRLGMSEEAFEQEMLCSFTAAIQGAIYSKQISALQHDGRLTSVKYDDSLPVVAALDLGHRDLMPAGFVQMAGTEMRWIWCKVYQFTSIPAMLADWADTLPFRPEVVILPHDARVTELGTGKTRQEVIEDLGYQTTIAPRQSLDEGIEQVRRAIPHMWIDADNAYSVFENLSGYRSEMNELRGVYKATPLHDAHSHGADMVRYMVQGDKTPPGRGFGPRSTGKFGV